MIVRETRSVLGSELHYQAMIYHALRRTGRVPADQLGMNVKQLIDDPVTDLFQSFGLRKHEDYQGSFEPIPDIAIFRPTIRADWRRRNREKTLRHMLLAIEVKASERKDSRLTPGEIIRDIDKLVAHREEAAHRQAAKRPMFAPVMMVIDTAPEEKEQMTWDGFARARQHAHEKKVAFYYLCQSDQVIDVPSSL